MSVRDSIRRATERTGQGALKPPVDHDARCAASAAKVADLEMRLKAARAASAAPAARFDARAAEIGSDMASIRAKYGFSQ
jgi:hypothetical protein